ncbi:MAG TPA: type II and III secretion system protein [Cytophagaceae bacterium]|nr:type II and III secretion system protein [Cytophagaceae bacterium]
MKNRIKLFLLIVAGIFFYSSFTYGQDQDRFIEIQEHLNELAKNDVPGLSEKVEFSVSGASIQEFLRGLAEAHSLNVSVDPELNLKITNNFTNEKVSNILMFLIKEYDLDIRFVGSIMSIVAYEPPALDKPLYKAKEIIVKYNSYTNFLTLDLIDDTLSDVVKRITQVSKKNVIMGAGVQDKKISVYIEEMPFDNALQKMAYANQLKITKTDDNFYVIKALGEDEDPLVVSGNQRIRPKGYVKVPGGVTTTTNSANGVSSGGANTSTSGGVSYIEVIDSLGRKYISLEAINAPITDVIKLVAQETGLSYFLFSDIKGHTTTKITNVDFSGFLSLLLKGSTYTYKNDNGVYLIGDRIQEGLRAYKVVQLYNRAFTSVSEVIPAELKKGVEIKEFKELNSILLSGSYPQIMEIEAFITQIDRVVPMVMIEVTLIDVTKGTSLTTGISAGIKDSLKSGGNILPGVNFTLSANDINSFVSHLGLNNVFNIGKVSPSFYATINALSTNNNVVVHSIPKLSTLNGHDANLSIGNTRYYSVNTQNVLGSLSPQTVVTQQWHAVEANLAITITPVVSADDQVTMAIDVNITDFTSAQATNQPPPSSTSKFKSMIRVQDEEMIILGGIERTERSKSGSGLPLLSRIPLLKYLFSNVSNSTSKVVTIVFIKPTIIY